MRKTALLTAIFVLMTGGAFAQTAETPEVPVPPLSEETQACLATFFPSKFKIQSRENGYEIRDADFGLLFSRGLACDGGKASLDDVVIIGEPIKTGQAIGSAMKADNLTIWAPLRREACAIPVDYGFEVRNFRWFNWNDNATDGGNKRFEVIRTAEGKEVRISTMSHLRSGKIIWTPKPQNANAPCAPAGAYQVENLDVRWSRGGTAHGGLVGAMRGDISFPVTPEDARNATKPAFFTFTGTNVSLTDITESVTSRMTSVSGKIEVTPDSALPWSFLIKKYARDLVYRQEDDSLLLRILPIDLANTFHFTKGVGTLSVPNATISPAAFLPSSVGYDLGRVNLSSVFTSFEVAIGLNGREPGEFKLNSHATGVGKLESVVGFRTQLFGKEYLKAASEGTVNLQGKTGPGITNIALTFENMGFVDIFLSTMKSKPSTYVIRNNTSNMSFWQQVSTWLSRMEQGQVGTLDISLAKPHLMIDGFWHRAPEGARAQILETSR